MIHWHTDANEDTWVNEGLSELARQINGYETGGGAYTFSLVPDTQLNAWGEAASGLIAHYGNSYLFMSYFLDRFGEQMMRQVVSNPANGIQGFNTVLQQAGSPFDFDAIFADWLVANYVDDPSVEEGFWGYSDLIVPQPALDAEHWQYPVERQGMVNQYAADYIAFEGQGQLAIDFEGMTQVKVAPTQAHSGMYQWWSNRGDDSDMTLTRRFDLSNVDQASLQFWIWYDIEKDWDYAFVEVSQDGGVTWDILPGVYSTMENKSGNSFGPAWTGTSGGGETAQWILESVDLTPYTGQVVDVRFEYLTDDAVNHVGLLLDDIFIPEIAYLDDVEVGDGGWLAEGFVRMDNVLPQKYVVQAIELGDSLQVERMQLDANNNGHLVIPLGWDVSRVVLVVSGITPFTTQPSAYTYRANLN
jgi:hypothetical protein